MIKIAPSILASDYRIMGAEFHALGEYGADMIHYDVMDGHFVPNISFGPGILKSLRRESDLPVDVHLMVSEPEKWVDPFISAGADWITFHIEARPEPVSLLRQIRSKGIRTGLVVNPESDVSLVFPYISECDMILLMSVHPGFGGQKFIPETIKKIALLREQIDRIASPCELEVDGGITVENAGACIEAGATVLVAGSTVFRSENPAETITLLRG